MNGEILTTLIATALGVGGATVIGALLGLFFKNISHKISDTVLAFASGVMLASAACTLRCTFPNVRNPAALMPA